MCLDTDSSNANLGCMQGTRVVLYARVSTEDQGENGASLDAQRAKLAAYAALHDLVTVDVVSEVASAKTLARPGLARALDMLESGDADAIAVTKLDRLTRRMLDLSTLVDRYFERRFSLLSVNDNIDTRSATGRMMVNMIGMLAQWERETIAERTKSALAHMRSNGVAMGAAPLGQRYSAPDESGRRTLVEDELEAIALARIQELHTQGMQPTAIARVMNERGFVTKRGKDWHTTTVRRILKRTWHGS